MVRENIVVILDHIFAVICLLGLIQNILLFLVLSRRKFQTTIFSTYFRYLCLIDSLTLIGRIDYFLLTNGLDNFRYISSITCKIAFFVIYLLPSSHGWIIFYIAFDRFLSISMPNRFLFRKKSKFQYTLCMITLFYNMVFYIPLLFTTESKLNQTNTNRIVYDCRNQSQLVNSIDIINATVLPFILMLISNILSVRTIFKSRQKGNYSTKIKKKDTRFAITSISLNISFLFLNIPLSIYLTLENVFNLQYYSLTFIILTFLFYSNYGSLFHVLFMFHVFCKRL